MAKQNNSLTELQALEGIYEHLSTIDDLAKEVGTISTRLRKIEEQLKEPMEIADPILNPGHSREYSRDTCIYGALIKSIEACIGLTDQKNVLNDIVSDVRHVKSALEIIKKDQTKQNKASEDMMIAIKENAENTESKHKLVFAMFILVFIAVVANYFILMFIFRRYIKLIYSIKIMCIFVKLSEDNRHIFTESV